MLTQASGQRVAVVGAGMAGLACARELALLGCDPVVFEASERLGGRCGARRTRAGWFDDAAQYVDVTELPMPSPFAGDDLLFARPWAPAQSHQAEVQDEDAPPVRPALAIGVVGTPSMTALAEALAASLDIRFCTPVRSVQRRAGRWILQHPGGPIDEDFQALVLALPAPLALPLAARSAMLSRALDGVTFRSRWVLLLATEQRLNLPAYREIQGAPIERIAAIHAKPGRVQDGLQRWFIEADATWSSRHVDDGPDAVAELLLANLCEHAGQAIRPILMEALLWRHGVCVQPAATPRGTSSLWDADCELGVCGDSVVASRVGAVVRSGTDLARLMVAQWTSFDPAPDAAARRRDNASALRAAA
jgi:renalase